MVVCSGREENTLLHAILFSTPLHNSDQPHHVGTILLNSTPESDTTGAAS
jgi:hypothetical protein